MVSYSDSYYSCGDISPETVISRITGSIATYFLKNNENSNIKESLKHDIDNIENLSNDDIERLIKIIKTYRD